MISRSFYLRKPIPCILGFGLLFLSACTQKAFDKSAPKTMQLSLPDEVKSADPASSNDTVSAELIGHIFEGLLQFSYSGVLGSLDPALAEAMPVLSDNNTTIKFKLKSGIFFQDDPAFLNGKGRNVSSDDFIYSFKRIADPASGSTNWWMFDGLVDGFNEWRSALEKASSSEKKTYFDKPVVGLTAEGPLALTIHLKRAYPQLLYILAMQPTAVVAREVVEKYGPEVQNHPVGTGPFRLKSWVRSSEIVVEKNPGYRTVYFPGSQDRLPFVQEIHWHILKEEQPMWLKFRKGELDITGIPKDNFAEAIGADGKVKADLAKQGVLLNKEPTPTSWWIEFNSKDPLLGKNLKLRRALAFAFDRSRALDLLFNNRGVLSGSPIPPSFEAGTEFPPYPYEYSVEKAKAMLAEAGFPEGKGLPPLTFDLRGPGATERQLAELLKENYSKIGINLTTLANSFPEALEKQKTARFQIMLGGWAADYPDPENFLQLFYSKNAAPGTNTSNFSNKEYDKLYEEIRTQTPSPERDKAIHHMVEILQTEATVAFFYHPVTYRLSYNWLLHYKPNPILYSSGTYYDIDRNLKAKFSEAK